jgi:putative CocE/NonD family hydrolase
MPFKYSLRMRHLALLCLLCFGGLIALAQAAPPKPETPTGYQLEMHAKIPLRDGIHLNATLYKPIPSSGPLPVVFMLSPYPDDTSHPSAAYFARYGYIYAYVDVRGRGDSEGVFNPIAQEAQDGYDVVEWFAKQPWCNGKVAMFGGSYAGGDQWAAASLHPPHLQTIAPVASVRATIDFPFEKNIKFPYVLQWLSFTSGHVLYSGVFKDQTVWGGAARRLYLAKAPFNQFDRYAGNTTTVFQQWLSHPEIDDYWKKIALTREQVAGISLPILVLTGSHDGDQLGTLSYYADHITSTDRHALDNYFLVIGPWNHPGTREPKQDFDGEHYGTASLLDVLRLHREWYDYTMKSGPKPAFLQKRVAYYVAGTGAECWKYADSLADVTSKSKTFYLDATGGATSVYHSGSLKTSPDGAAGATFISDPNDLSAADSSPSQNGSDLHGDGLIFHTAPLEQDTEIDGMVDLRLSLSIDAPDTDLSFSLDQVTPEGKVRSLTFGMMRARYRHSLERGEPIHQNEVEEYRFTPDLWFANRLSKGSQLRLIVRTINDPSVEKNWNSMKPVAEQSGADARIAHITLVQTKDHPSTLTIPTGDPAAACKASADW